MTPSQYLAAVAENRAVLARQLATNPKNFAEFRKGLSVLLQDIVALQASAADINDDVRADFFMRFVRLTAAAVPGELDSYLAYERQREQDPENLPSAQQIHRDLLAIEQEVTRVSELPRASSPKASDGSPGAPATPRGWPARTKATFWEWFARVKPRLQEFLRRTSHDR